MYQIESFITSANQCIEMRIRSWKIIILVDPYRCFCHDLSAFVQLCALNLTWIFRNCHQRPDVIARLFESMIINKQMNMNILLFCTFTIAKPRFALGFMNEIECCGVRAYALWFSFFFHLFRYQKVTHSNREQKHVFIFQLLLLLLQNGTLRWKRRTHSIVMNKRAPIWHTWNA